MSVDDLLAAVLDELAALGGRSITGLAGRHNRTSLARRLW
jgi:hypothetical protein